MSNSSRSGCELLPGLAQHVADLVCNHQFLIGRDDPGRWAAPARNPGPPACVRDLIKLKSSPCGTAQNLRACHGIVLTDPGRKDESIDAPEGRHERPHLSSDPVDEQVDRLPGMGICCR